MINKELSGSKGGKVRKIYVEPERILSSSKKIEDYNNEFKQLKQKLYEEVDMMTNAWNGKDNQAFTNQIKTYQNTMNSISLIMSQYCNFLNNSANAYRQTQEEIYSEAMKICN